MQEEQPSSEPSLRTRWRDDVASTRKGLHHLERGMRRFGSKHRGAAAFLALGVGCAVTYRARRSSLARTRSPLARFRAKRFDAPPAIGLLSAGALIGFTTRLIFNFAQASHPG